MSNSIRVPIIIAPITSNLLTVLISLSRSFMALIFELCGKDSNNLNNRRFLSPVTSLSLYVYLKQGFFSLVRPCFIFVENRLPVTP